jgi:hypothetical protein
MHVHHRRYRRQRFGFGGWVVALCALGLAFEFPLVVIPVLVVLVALAVMVKR